jgi:hypothetical protein
VNEVYWSRVRSDVPYNSYPAKILLLVADNEQALCESDDVHPRERKTVYLIRAQ